MKKLLGILAAIHDQVTVASAILASVGLIAIVSFYVLEVVARYFFNTPTSWASDFVTYTLAASVFLALPKVTRDRGHVAVTILVDVLPDKVAGAMHVIVNALGFAALSLATWISLAENIRQFNKGIVTLAIVPIPQWWVSSFITFGLALSALYMLRHIPPSHRNDENTMAGSAG